MSTVTPLAAFCAVMALIAAGRVAWSDERDALEIGSVIFVFGVTALVFLWIAVRRGWSPSIAGIPLAVVGATLSGVGIALIARGW